MLVTQRLEREDAGRGWARTPSQRAGIWTHPTDDINDSICVGGTPCGTQAQIPLEQRLETVGARSTYTGEHVTT